MLRRMLFVGVLSLMILLPVAAAQPPEKVKRPGPPPGAAPIPQELLEPAREAVELAEAELELKRAHVAAAQVGVKSAERQLQHSHSLGKAITETEKQLISFSHEKAVAEVRIKEAEMKIGEIKLQHARRKLARLEPPPKPKEDK